jgi:hypothetical protein
MLEKIREALIPLGTILRTSNLGKSLRSPYHHSRSTTRALTYKSSSSPCFFSPFFILRPYLNPLDLSLPY